MCQQGSKLYQKVETYNRHTTLPALVTIYLFHTAPQVIECHFLCGELSTDLIYKEVGIDHLKSAIDDKKRKTF